MKHVIRQYRLESGAQEVAYMEEMFTEFSGRKSFDINTAKSNSDLLQCSRNI